MDLNQGINFTCPTRDFLRYTTLSIFGEVNPLIPTPTSVSKYAKQMKFLRSLRFWTTKHNKMACRCLKKHVHCLYLQPLNQHFKVIDRFAALNPAISRLVNWLTIFNSTIISFAIMKIEKETVENNNDNNKINLEILRYSPSCHSAYL